MEIPSKFKSKKFFAMIAGAIANLALMLGMDVPPELALWLTNGLVAIYILTQGAIDFIKERRKK